MKDRLQNIKLFLATYETGSDESEFHGENYQMTSQDFTDKDQLRELNLNLAVIHDTKEGANLSAENIRVWLRCDECTIDTTNLNIEGLGEKKEIKENGNQTWTVIAINKHSPPAPLRLRDIKINAPKNKAEITLLYRIYADSMRTVDSKLILKTP